MPQKKILGWEQSKCRLIACQYKAYLAAKPMNINSNGSKLKQSKADCADRLIPLLSFLEIRFSIKENLVLKTPFS